MSRVFVCLSVLFILSIAVRFGDCQNNTIDHNTECENESAPGSDETDLSPLEKLLRAITFPFDAMGNIGRIIFRRNKDNSQSKDGGSFGSILEKYKKEVRLIYPGTLWCGDGDIARNETDLGLFKKTDACCRAHDNCKNDILSGKTKRNLKNNGIFTRSACTCDNAFYKCLKDADNLLSSKIGYTYFNILRPQCFRCICPTDDCNLDDGTECKDLCTKYEWVNHPKFFKFILN